MVNCQKLKLKLIGSFLLANSNDTLFYRIESKKICQRIRIFVICKKSIRQIWGKLIHAATKTELDLVKTASKEVSHKRGEARSEEIKLLKKIVKLKPVPDENSINVEEIIIPTEKGMKY